VARGGDAGHAGDAAVLFDATEPEFIVLFDRESFIESMPVL
jgi:hypothetical protein